MNSEVKSHATLSATHAADTEDVHKIDAVHKIETSTHSVASEVATDDVLVKDTRLRAMLAQWVCMLLACDH